MADAEEEGRPSEAHASPPEVYHVDLAGEQIGRERAGFLRWKACGRPSHGLGPKLILEGGSIVNAAFLLVTSAWLAGQAPPPPPVAPAPPPAHAYPAPAASSACCDTGCG